ncbi:MAG: hypothetical protein CL520_07070 [Actinobacteria bacterium]|uniref:Cytochrome P450 n=1 Tax=marine metagenome TaxID=408172 RepID=A0A381PYX5_9ZZZZ|nr:hypothetical protein [Actinomycetota bacterium]MEC8921373.1 cytochrome P450 [Actinomycetota bacterium]|tara:strand:+ start:1044 stop:2402 length:1359 start_codon:yes stop_codon:yes gene_type:complete
MTESPDTSNTQLDEFNIFDPGVQQCPHMYYAMMREETAAYETRAMGGSLFLVTRHGDVADAALDHSHFSSRFDTGSMEGNSEFSQRLKQLYEDEGGYEPVGTMLTVDPPVHTRYRRLVAQAFTPKAIANLEPVVRSLTAELLDNLIQASSDGASIDFVESFAVPLPVRVMAKALNVPDDRLKDFKRWSDASVAGIGTNISIDERLDAEREVIEFQKYFAAQLERRRITPEDDLLTALVGATIEREDSEADEELVGVPLNVNEMLSIIQQLLVAGNETTTHLLGEMFRLLAENRGEWEALRSEPERSSEVVEEALRLAAPTQGMFRIATEDVEVGSEFIAAGSRMVLLYAAANRDPNVWEDPDAFQPGRENSAAHLSFGRGPHFCVGAGLARLEARIVAEEMGRRLESIEVTNSEQLRYHPSFVLRGLQRLDVTVSAKEVSDHGGDGHGNEPI